MTNERYFKIITAMENDIREVLENECMNHECTTCSKMVLCKVVEAIEAAETSCDMSFIDIYRELSNYGDKKGI